MSLKYIVVDDHLAVRQLLVQGLKVEFGDQMECVGEVNAGHEGLVVCLAQKPDFLILDVELPVLSGVEVVRHLRPLLPDMKIICFSGCENPEKLAELHQQKIQGFVSKSAPLEDLLKAVKIVIQGGTSFADTFKANNNGGTVAPASVDLTLREKEVLQLVARSRTTKEIATTLYLSPKTVEKHRSTLMHKLKIRDAAGLTRYAIRHGFAPTD